MTLIVKKRTKSSENIFDQPDYEKFGKFEIAFFRFSLINKFYKGHWSDFIFVRIWASDSEIECVTIDI